MNASAHTGREDRSGKAIHRLLLVCFVAMVVGCAKSSTVTVRIIGLSDASRANDFKEVIKKVPSVKLVRFDSDKASASLDFQPATQDQKSVPSGTVLPPDKVISLIDGLVGDASSHTFSVTAPTGVAEKNLSKLTYKVSINDCKGCRYAAYLAVAKLEGVDRASLDSSNNILVAWIDPTKTSKKAVGDALTDARIKWRDK